MLWNLFNASRSRSRFRYRKKMRSSCVSRCVYHALANDRCMLTDCRGEDCLRLSPASRFERCGGPYREARVEVARLADKVAPHQASGEFWSDESNESAALSVSRSIAVSRVSLRCGASSPAQVAGGCCGHSGHGGHSDDYSNGEESNSFL